MLDDIQFVRHFSFPSVVGYSTVTVNKEWTIYAVNFEKVSGGDLTIQDAFPYCAGMTKGSQTTGDQIQVQDGEGYKIYFMSDGHFKKMGKDTYDANRDGKWILTTSQSAPATATLAAGQAFWYKAASYSTPWTMTVAGVVPTAVQKNILVNKAWTHIANPYPVALSLNNGIGFADGMTKGSQTTGDQIQIQDGAGYKIYFLSDGHFKKMGKDTYDANRDGKWILSTSQSAATADTIPVGLGAWYKRMGSTDIAITINSPIAE